jgi:molybdopterin/thiamine biosynthesis adenylyltransferase
VSNLQRQTLHSDATVGQPKVISARDALTRINPYIAITPVNALLDDSEIHALIAEHDLVLDCTDNVSIRNQLNAGCLPPEFRWFPVQQFAWKGKLPSLRIRKASPATVA